MIACPFRAPVETVSENDGFKLKCRRFELRGGLSFSKCRWTASGADRGVEWPFESFSQLVFVISGEIGLSLPDRGRQTVTSGDWFLISLKGWHGLCEMSGELDFLTVECSEEIWRSFSTELDALHHTKKACFGCAQRSEAIFVKNLAHARLRSHVDRLARFKGDTPSERLRIEAHALELMASVLETDRLGEAPKAEPCLREEDEDALELAAAYLEENLATDHSIAALSRRARLNEFKLKRGFRERFSTTVFGYLKQKRMERARELFTRNHKTVLEVANAVGYSNPSHFARAFREAHGVNPKEFVSEVRA